METCPAWTETSADSSTSFTAGKVLGNGGRGRHWVVLKGPEMQALQEFVKGVGDGAVFAVFQEGPHALMHKLYDAQIKGKDSISVHSPLTEGRVSSKATKEIIDKFLAVAIAGNFVLKTVVEDDANVWKMVCEQVCLVYSHQQLLEYMANASYAVRKKKATQLQDAAVGMEKYVNAFIKDRVKSDAMMKNVRDIDYKFPEDYKSSLLDTKGVYWDYYNNVIKVITLREAVLTGDMYLRRAFFFVGQAGRGKSELIQSIGSRVSERHGYSKQIIGKAIDPLGLLSRSGAIQEAGCLNLSDFTAKTCKDDWLDVEGAKNLIGVGEPGEVPARYHFIQIDKKLPRLFAINSSVYPKEHDNKGQIWWSHWFEKNYPFEALAALCNNEADKIKQMGGDQEGIVRRAVIFKIDGFIYEKVEQAQDSISDYYKAGMAREAELGM